MPQQLEDENSKAKDTIRRKQWSQEPEVQRLLEQIQNEVSRKLETACNGCDSLSENQLRCILAECKAHVKTQQLITENTQYER
jgi:hypothetical protein